MQRTALVTGGTRGLGKAIALALQGAGHKVAVVYHSNEPAAKAFSQETGMPAFHWDVSDFQSCAQGVAQVEREIGPIEILVNDAGITADAVLHKMELEQWRRVIDTNLGSMFNMCRAVIEGMRAREFGRIVNISSVNGQKGQFGQSNYSAAKAGILGFTKALALESAHKNITVNAIAPGYCDTDMVSAVSETVMKAILAGIPVGRLGTPAEIGRVAAFLADDASGFITGTTIEVNGGQYMD
ncbi:MAG TPA: acetoacetyl-CoA reductase [Burkholderiaceae bacterium]